LTLAHFIIYNVLSMSITYPTREGSASQHAAVRTAWLAGLVLGVADGFTYLLVPVVAVLLIGLGGALFSWKGPRLAAIGGFLSGFGLCWVALLTIGIADCSAANVYPGQGCRSENAVYFLATGCVILLVGALATRRAARSRTGSERQRGGGLGASVGFLGSLVIAAVLGAVDSIGGANPSVVGLGLAIVAAGTAGCWLVGPRAVAARSGIDWAKAIFLLGGWAVLIGSAVVVLELVLDSAARVTVQPLSELAAQAPLALVTWSLGVVVAGPYALPFTLVAAALWAWLMSRLRPADT
jgi:hypothetical protein